jgi:hypothetical protein
MELRPMKTIAVCSQTHTNTLGGLQRVSIDEGTQLWRISVSYLTPPVQDVFRMDLLTYLLTYSMEQSPP